jgi:hypothetical protein
MATGFLLKLAGDWPGRLDLRVLRRSDQAAFHAKFALFQRKGRDRALVGSANLTERGLRRNLEASVLLDDVDCVRSLRAYFEEMYLGGRSRPVSKGWLAKYERAWQRSTPRELPAAIKVSPPRLGPPRIKGYEFAFTGAIPEWPRDSRLYPLIERYGGYVAEKAASMKSADCLVHGKIAGDREVTEKLVKAHESDIPVITAEDFFEAVEREKKLRQRA